MKKQVIIGLLGSRLDQGSQRAGKRWQTWRPTVALFQQEGMRFDRLELLVEPKFDRLARQVEQDIRSLNEETEVRLHRVEWSDAWDLEQVYSGLHAFATAYAFDTDREDYFVHISTGTHVAQICLYLLTEARYLPGRLIQTSPSPKAEERPQGTVRIIDLDLSRYDQIASRFRQEKREGASFLKQGIETRNAAFNALIDRIENVAVKSKAPMLLMGPTGAGKSQLARQIYELKKRRRQLDGPFVGVNCATIRGEGAMSTLFGHVRGAFTGAVGPRAGLLREADGGMLFLDEIGELGADEQAMLLRAIEEKLFFPVGSDREVASEFQLIAGTNRDLKAEVARGGFREDLLARINLWTFELPALRERPEDIEPNVEYELSGYVQREGQFLRMSADARKKFLSFATSGEAAWMGNFRDLNAAITRMGTLSAGGRITAKDVEEEIGRLRAQWSAAGRGGQGGDAELLEDVLGEKAAELDRFDRAQLADVIRMCRESRSLSEAGRKLFAVSRTKRTTTNDADRLRKYLGRFGLEWGEVGSV